MKSSSAPNKTPSLKRPLAFFPPPSIPSLLCFFSCPLLLLLHPRETCLPYLRRRTTQERWLRHWCVCEPVCVCVHTTLELYTHLTECSTHIFRTFSVNINACLYLLGWLWAVCLLVHACACASLILWAKVWNERQRHIADGKVREAFKLPTVGLSSRGSLHLFTPAARFSPSCPSVLQYLSVILTFLKCLFFFLISSTCPTFSGFLLTFLFLHAPFILYLLLSLLLSPP